MAINGLRFQHRFELLTFSGMYQQCGWHPGYNLVQLHDMLNPFVPTVAFSQPSSNICCSRDCVSRTAHVGTVEKNGLTRKNPVHVFGLTNTKNATKKLLLSFVLRSHGGRCYNWLSSVEFFYTYLVDFARPFFSVLEFYVNMFLNFCWTNSV